MKVKYLEAIVPDTRWQYGFHTVYEIIERKGATNEAVGIDYSFMPIAGKDEKRLFSCKTDDELLAVVVEMQHKYWELLKKDCLLGSANEGEYEAERRLRMSLNDVFYEVFDAEKRRHS